MGLLVTVYKAAGLLQFQVDGPGQAGGGVGQLLPAVIVSASLCKCVGISIALMGMLGGLFNI